MTTTAPAVPPRPSRGADKDNSSGSIPKIPPRPSKMRPDRSVSPNPDRFAPSPFNEGGIPPAKTIAVNQPLLSPGIHEPVEDPIERAGSVPMPSVGEEGLEYAAVAQEIENDNKQESEPQVASPEHTSTIAHDLKLHAPKPSLPADSAKQRVQAVTRTDSDKAASYGFGVPSSRDDVKKKASTTLSTETGSENTPGPDDEQGIPEIGQRVPMNPLLGDVQAPSSADSDAKPKGHVRNHSSRGLPPGSYGLHGHGVTPQDKLDKAYYEKHPEALKRELSTPIHERQNGYALTREELNKLVRDTVNRGNGVGAGSEYRSTPTEEVGFQASEEYAQRIASPHLSSGHPSIKSPRTSQPSLVLPDDHNNDEDDEAIHVDDPKHPEYRSYGDGDIEEDNSEQHQAPILAPDEADTNPNGYLQQPAVHPPPERRGSPYEMDDVPSRPTSRPVSRHYEDSKPEIQTTPLEDVEEYEPLFPEEAKKEAQAREQADENKNHRQFPSKDIWEDAPSSVHYTATVSTPDVPETEHHRPKSSGTRDDQALTPAQIFARKQEELAEQEAERRSKDPNVVVVSPSEERKPTWAEHQTHVAKVDRPSSGPKFPSRDVWEDVPESHVYEATIDSPPGETKPEQGKAEESKPSIPARPARKSPDSSERPAVPSRPKPRQSSGDDKARPVVSDKPKPQVPARSAKSLSGDAKEAAASKPKPPVPSRPVGGKIAALQAGFMSDLNKRLQLGPQGPKKEEPPEPAAVEEKEKAPLSDARKGRARGPQRRAPAKSPAAPTAETKAAVATPSFSISLPVTTWSISPEVGDLEVSGDEKEKVEVQKPIEAKPIEATIPLEKKTEPEAEPAPAERTFDEMPEEKPEAEPAVEQESKPNPQTEVEPEAEYEAKAEAKAEPVSAELDQPGTEKVDKKVEEPELEVKATGASEVAVEAAVEAGVEKKEAGDAVKP